MTDDPMVALREAVDALTQPVHISYMQHEIDELVRTPENTRQQGTVRFNDPSLLEQLRAAVSNSLGGGGRSPSGRSARERTPLDVASFSLYEDIDGRVRAWLLDAGIRPSKSAEPSEILRRWFVMWKTKQVEPDAVDAHTKILERFATSIRDLLTPPAKQEIERRCPRCKSMWATVGAGEEMESVRALWAVWKADPDDSYAICRNCPHTWLGVGQMRLLNIAIDDDDKQQKEDAEREEGVVVPELAELFKRRPVFAPVEETLLEPISSHPNSGLNVSAMDVSSSGPISYTSPGHVKPLATGQEVTAID